MRECASPTVANQGCQSSPTSDARMLTPSTITEFEAFNGSLRSVVQSTNAEFVRAGDYRHRFGVHGRGLLCRAAIATVAIFGSNGFSWNYFSVDAGVRVRRSLRRIQNPEFAVGAGFSP